MYETTTTETLTARGAAGRMLRQREEAPGSEAAIETAKKRKPAANATSCGTSKRPEEADEERLADAEAVERERHHLHEEEERAEDDVDDRRDVGPDGLAAEPDGDHAHELGDERDGQDTASITPCALRYSCIAL